MSQKMSQNTNEQTKAGSTASQRMKISVTRGSEAWFDVDDITIHLWASTWSGREIVTVCQGQQKRVVSDKRSWRFSTPHEFEHDGQHYRVLLLVGFGKIAVELYRNRVLIDSDEISKSGIRIDPATGRLDWKYALQELALPLLAGLAVGVSFGYLAGVVFK